MKKQSLLLISLVSLAVCACNNPLMDSLLQTKTIFFDSNGGSFVPPQTLFKKEKISIPRTPVKEGYFFGGWFTYLDDYYMGYDDDNYDNNKWDFNIIPEGDMTLYASWHEGSTPTAKDFSIDGGGYFEYDGNPKVVTVTPRGGITVGKRTVYYEGSGNTIYDKTTNAPINPGTYTVTFDVEAAEGWNAAYKLEAGELTIGKAIPIAGHYDISNNLTQRVTDLTKIEAVNVNVKTGGIRSPGDVTVYYEELNSATYTRSPNKPHKIGSYYVTFDVAASTDGNWNEANGIEAGILEINVFKNIEVLGTWLGAQIQNNTTNPYPVALNVRSLGGSSGTLGSAGYTIKKAARFISLDLSGNTFEFIETSAFSSCEELISVIIPNSVISIEDFAFKDTSLTSVTIPDSVTSIEQGAFLTCTNLSSVIIGSQVQIIGDYAFYDTALTSVTFKKDNASIGDNAFLYDNDLRSKYLNGKAGTYIYETSISTPTWIKKYD